MKQIGNGLSTLVLLASFIVPIHAGASASKSQPRITPQGITDGGVVIEPASETGAIIEPSLRMKFKDAPWDYEVRIALPPSYPKSDKSYPVLWVTDGSARFTRSTMTVNWSAAAGEIPEMIVVSVGAPRDVRGEAFGIRRTYDFSADSAQPCAYVGPGKDLYDKECKGYFSKIPANAVGGAPKFLEFMVSDVRAAIKSKYRVSGDNTLFGNSGGGAFCGYALLTRPDSFDRYICGSPSLGELFPLEEQYAKTHSDLKAKVFFGAGEGEILQGGLVSALGVFSSMSRMAEILKLRGYPSLELHVQIFPDRVHGPMTADNNLYWGLRALFSADIQARK